MKFELQHKDEVYVFELTRSALLKAEEMGFSLSKMTDNVIGSVYVLAWVSMLKERPSLRYKEAITIVDDLLDNEVCSLDDLLDCLVKLVQQVFPMAEDKPKIKKIKMK